MKAAEDIGAAVLGDIYRLMHIDDEWAVTQTRSISWWPFLFRQRIWAEPALTRSGLGIVCLAAESDLLIEVPDNDLTSKAVATLNSGAAMNGLIWRPDEKRITLRCSTTIHPEIRGWMTNLFASAVAMQICEAPLLAKRLIEVVGGSPAASGHPTSGMRSEPDDMMNVQTVFTSSDDKSPYGDEMAQLAALLQRQYVANGDTDGLTVEFPFPGAFPPTVMVQIFADQPHPIYGSGVLIVLKLPSLPDGMTTGPALANGLNIAEIGQDHAGYGFGSWCIDPQTANGIAYTLFLPAAGVFKPGLLRSIVDSLARKVQWAHLLFSLENDKSKVGVWHKLQQRMLNLLVAKRSRQESGMIYDASSHHRFQPGDELLISARDPIPVTKELEPLCKFFGAVLAHKHGDAGDGRHALESLIAGNEMKSIQQPTSALVLGYAQKDARLARIYPYFPWDRIVRIKLIDGEGAGLEVWADDSLLSETQDSFHRSI